MTNMSEGEKLRADHRDICGQLNIDVATEEQSWNSFQEVRRTYNLDVSTVSDFWASFVYYVISVQAFLLISVVVFFVARAPGE